MTLRFGSARIDENGNVFGGAAGDQTGKEVMIQDFYVHNKGWYIFRSVNPDHAEKIAERMTAACNNNNIGYDQYNRLGVIKYGIGTNNKTECDCSSLVRQCIIEATGIDVGNFTTATESAILTKSGLFKERITYKNGITLYDGDILVTKTKGHTGIIVSGNARTITNKTKTINQIAIEVINGKWSTGDTRKQMLKDAGYDYAAVQAEVNKILLGR